jgi:uncharacterized membrane protein
MTMPLYWIIIWLVCGAATLVGAVLAHRGRRWRLVGRAGVGVLFVFGGALLHAVFLATGQDYTDFADTAHFAWVTDAWRAVVAPNQPLFIGMLAVFEATVGTLILSGGRCTQLGYLGVIAFYAALWIFGGVQTVWVLAMLPLMALLLHAERRVMARAAPADRIEERPLAGVGA